MRRLLFCIFTIAFYTSVLSQPTFKKVYPDENSQKAIVKYPRFLLEQFPGQYIIGQINQIHVTDNKGEVLSAVYQNHPDSLHFYNACLNNDGSYLVAGREGAIYVSKIGAANNILWEKHFGYNGDGAYGISKTADGGYLVSGFIQGQSMFMKLNAQGDSLWTIFAHGTGNFDTRETDDGGYLALLFGAGSSLQLYKTDSLGDSLWVQQSYLYSQSFGNISNNAGTMIVKGDSIITSTNNYNDITIKIFDINNNGSIIGSIDIIADSVNHDIPSLGFFPTDDGGYMLAGLYAIDNATGEDTHYPYFYKLDADFNVLTKQYHPDPVYRMLPTRVIETNDGGYLMCGMLNYTLFPPDPIPEYPFLMKVDEDGNLHKTFIAGTVYHDENTDCNFDTTETPLANWLVKADGLLDYYAVTNTDGQYVLNVDTGNYTLSFHRPSPYWDTLPCNVNQVNITASPGSHYDTTELNYGIEALINCPVMEVNLSTFGLRPCFNTSYDVSYCNHGTVPADSAYVDVMFHPFIDVQSASLPYTTLPGNRIRFQLGTVVIGECGSLNIVVKLQCGLDIGPTYCATAHIYPDSSCVPENPFWSGASLKLDGECVNNDSVEFRITNTGQNMLNPTEYGIIQDDVMYAMETLTLNSGMSKIHAVPANGATWTLLLKQVSGHPGFSAPSMSIEGCGLNNMGAFSTGFVTQFPNDDQAPHIDIECIQSTGSFDPNDKTPSPLGVGAEGLIEIGQPLTYKIRFQNTGTDTAFYVVIRDTLTELLDITSLQLDASSHEYTFEINPGRELVWYFHNILLPDSNRNEPASHGFVTFTINQVDGLPTGTVIENTAGIYFDFNDVVLTNTTYNKVTDDLEGEITVSIIETFSQNGITRLYPNPNHGLLKIDLTGISGTKAYLNMYDLFGRTVMHEAYIPGKVNSATIDLSKGFYFYEIISTEGKIAEGKLVVHY